MGIASWPVRHICSTAYWKFYALSSGEFFLKIDYNLTKLEPKREGFSLFGPLCISVAHLLAGSANMV